MRSAITHCKGTHERINKPSEASYLRLNGAGNLVRSLDFNLYTADDTYYDVRNGEQPHACLDKEETATRVWRWIRYEYSR